MPDPTHTIRLHRVLRAPPERLYRAFLDPDAMTKWLPPHGFTGKVHDMDARVGGGYRMSFTSFASGQSHAFGGRFLELTPHERIRYSDRFDDPDLPIIQDAFYADGVTGGGHVVAGLRVHLNHDFSITGEGRYHFAPTDDMGDDFGALQVDLSGWSATVGVRIEF